MKRACLPEACLPRACLLLLALLAWVRAAAPVPHGGAACTTDWDCALGGLCNASRRCACDLWFTGPNCTMLNLARAKPDNGFSVPGFSTWGGHAVRSRLEADGHTWRGFFSLIGL